MFEYNVIEGAGTETFPIQIDGQKDPNNPCYQMTRDMELKFTFHPASEEKCSSFTYPASDFIWKYELQLITGRYILQVKSLVQILGHLRPAIVLRCPLIGCLATARANERTAQNNYNIESWALGFQDLYF